MGEKMESKISVTRALAELKMLDKRIKAAIEDVQCAAVVQSENDQMVAGFKAAQTANLQKAKDLIARKNKLKAAVVQSNAATRVAIGGESMTVSEAIERKSLLELKKSLRDRLRLVLSTCKSEVENKNILVKNRADNAASAALAGETARTKGEEYESFLNAYIAGNSFRLETIANIESTIETLTNEIEEFELNVDFVLSESNTMTTINV